MICMNRLHTATCRCVCACACSYMYTCARTHAHTHTRTHAHAHTRADVHMDTHTCTHACESVLSVCTHEQNKKLIYIKDNRQQHVWVIVSSHLALLHRGILSNKYTRVRLHALSGELLLGLGFLGLVCTCIAIVTYY